MKFSLIGLAGYARSGKNSFADFIGDNSKSISFAYALRKELDNFLIEKLGISAFTEDPKEKEIVRPLLVCWGTEIMRNQIDQDHWVKSIKKAVEINRKNNICSIITDVRFENEIFWIKEKGGACIWIERSGIGPKNADEQNYTLPLKEKCDFVFSWPNLNHFESEGKKLAKEFLIKNNICLNTAQTKN